MDLAKLFYDMIDVRRDIYQEAQLFVQNRRDPSSYTTLLMESVPFDSIEKVADFIGIEDHENSQWQSQNKKFLKYHRSLTPHSFFNGIPIDHYIGQKTGLHLIQDKLVLDLGGGTGHFLASFFRYPETLQYFLVDPNVRQLHDQFVRMYPQLLELPIGHIRAYAEDIPFKDAQADLVVSSSAIDHYDSIDKFCAESYRCLKSGGTLLVSSHLKNASQRLKKIGGMVSLLEGFTRALHRVKNKVAINDHVEELEGIEVLKSKLEGFGFEIMQAEIFKQYFYISAQKP